MMEKTVLRRRVREREGNVQSRDGVMPKQRVAGNVWSRGGWKQKVCKSILPQSLLFTSMLASQGPVGRRPQTWRIVKDAKMFTKSFTTFITFSPRVTLTFLIRKYRFRAMGWWNWQSIRRRALQYLSFPVLYLLSSISHCNRLRLPSFRRSIKKVLFPNDRWTEISEHWTKLLPVSIYFESTHSWFKSCPRHQNGGISFESSNQQVMSTINKEA